MTAIGFVETGRREQGNVSRRVLIMFAMVRAFNARARSGATPRHLTVLMGYLGGMYPPSAT